MGATTLQAQERQSSGVATADAGRELKEQAEIRDAIRADCMARVMTAMSGSRLVTEADLAAYRDKVLSEAALEMVGKKTHEQKAEALREMKSQWIPAVATDAKVLEDDFHRKLKDAVGDGAISKEFAESWFSRLRPLIFWEKKQFIKNKFPEYLQSWKDVARERKNLLNHARVRSLTKDQVEDIDAFLDDDAFLALHFHERKGLTAEVRAALTAGDKGLEESHASAKTELLALAAGASPCLHRSKVGVWMQRIFDHCRTPAQVQQFLDAVVRPYALNWELARREFDVLEDRFDREEAPEGFRRLDADRFLLLPYEERLAYLSEAGRALDLATLENPDSPKAKRAALLKVRVRNAILVRDFDTAEAHLAEAEALVPEDAGVAALRAHLEEHRPPKGEEAEPTPEEARLQIRDAVRGVPNTVLQEFYGEALEMGPETFETFATLADNRVRKHEVDRVLDAETEREQAEATTAKPAVKEEKPVLAPAAVREQPVAEEPLAAPEATEEAPEEREPVQAEAETRERDAAVKEEKKTISKEDPLHFTVKREERREFLQSLPSDARTETEVSVAIVDEQSKPIPLETQKRASAVHPVIKRGLRVLAKHGQTFSMSEKGPAQEVAPAIDA